VDGLPFIYASLNDVNEAAIVKAGADKHLIEREHMSEPQQIPDRIQMMFRDIVHLKCHFLESPCH
jgi:hypothetical protein